MTWSLEQEEEGSLSGSTDTRYLSTACWELKEEDHWRETSKPLAEAKSEQTAEEVDGGPADNYIVSD